MQESNSSEKQPSSTENDQAEKPKKHNPFEDKKDHLTKEEQESIEEFKEAQTERD